MSTNGDSDPMRNFIQRPSRRPRERGFSLIEILVGMLIGLIGIIVIFQVLTVSENRKRTTSSGSDAQIAGSIALFAIERDLKLAGYGFGAAASTAATSAAGGDMMGCNVSVYDSQNPVVTFPLRLAPVEITDGVGGAPDTITVLWGSSARFVNYSKFTLPTPIDPATANVSKWVDQRNGIDRGDLMVVGGLTDPGDPLAGALGCHLLEVTDNTAADQITIGHVAGTYKEQNDKTIPADRLSRYNNPVGPGMMFAGKGAIYNLGSYPRANQWSIRSVNAGGAVMNGKLGITDLLHYLDADGDGKHDWLEIADGVIDLQAQYGYDANGDGFIDENEWTAAAPATWSRVRAIRVALLTRSGEYEKDYTAPNPPVWGCKAGAACTDFVMKNLDATSGTTAPGDPVLDWRHYRYRVYETGVPFRNVIWGATP